MIENNFEIINIIRNTLSYIDPRLVKHGERVAFIASQLIHIHPELYSDLDESKLLILCILHDIGAYKTEEIDNMMEFEVTNVFSHSIYGYLFLKNTTHLGEYAESLLYHHTHYNELKKLNCKYSRYAEIIFFSDRMDILIASNSISGMYTANSKLDINFFKAQLGKKFNPIDIECFCEIINNESYSLVECLFSQRYENHIKNLISKIDISTDEVLEYLKMITYAIDFRSVHTITHTANTTIISCELGRLLKLDKNIMIKLQLGAFLHDVGKIAIPVNILEKTGKLEKNEIDIMRSHIVKTEEIISGVVDDVTCKIASRHHEKLNGMGYPSGLTANDLTLPERIVAVADIASALTGKRSYKEIFSKEKTTDIISAMKDEGHLCPIVCDSFIDNYDEIFRNVQKNNDPIKKLYENINNEYINLVKLRTEK